MEQSWVVPCDFAWSMEEEEVERSDDGSIQTSFPSQGGLQQVVVEYAAPATHEICSDPMQVFEKGAQVFCDDYLRSMDYKMHRFPPSLVDVGEWCTTPVTVAIGPYHHGGEGVVKAEQVKHVAANQCIKDSGRSLQEVYDAVFSVSHVARSLYHQDDGVASMMGDDIFLPMMFFDACFLVQYMRSYDDDPIYDDHPMDEALGNYFCANYERICTDIMMLQNQIPWVVVKIILDFMPKPSPWEMFVAAMKSGLKNRAGSDLEDLEVLPAYEPPHLLGLVRYHIVGNNSTDKNLKFPRYKPMSLSISVAELTDVGITIVPKVEVGILDMQLRDRGRFCADLELPPLYLTEKNAALLVNMAAFELCKTPDFEGDRIDDEDSAVCSYLHLFAMLVDKKHDVQELRKKHAIEGGGLTSAEALTFFTCIGKNMRLGQCYLDIIIRIGKFKRKRSTFLKIFLFLKKNKNRIMALVSIIALVVGILSSLQALKTQG